MLVTVEDGRAVEVRGAPDHPPTAGVLCTKVARYLERTYSDERVLHPMRRVGRKGEGRFERIAWDEALATIAARFGAIAASPDGPQAILPYSYAGTMGLLQYGSMDRRFFHRLGASLLDRTICATAGKAGWVATVGAAIGMDVEQFENSRLILIWGSNPIASNLHFWTRAQEAKRRGAKLIAIDPYRSATAEKCHQHIALLSGHRRRARARDDARADRRGPRRPRLHRPPHRRLRRAARARRRVDAGARRADLRHPAGRRSSSSRATTARPGRRRSASTTACSATPAAATPCARSPACRRSSARGAIRPAARCCRRRAPIPSTTAALERPDLIRGTPRTINMSTIGDALLDGATRRSARSTSTTRIRSRSRRSRRRSPRASRARTCSASCTRSSRPTPPTTPTSCCRRRRSSSSSTSTTRTATSMRWRTIRRSRRSARRCRTPRCSAGWPRAWASTDPCFRDTDEDLARQAFAAATRGRAGLDWDALKRDGFARLAVPARYAPFAEGGFPTPSGKCEFHLGDARARRATIRCRLRSAARIGGEQSRRWRGAIRSRSSRRRRATSSTRRSRTCRAFVAEEKRLALDLHPDDAAARGIATATACASSTTAAASPRRRGSPTGRDPGVVVAPSIWWQKLAPDGANANAVTGQALTDLGRAATFYDCLVEVERA